MVRQQGVTVSGHIALGQAWTLQGAGEKPDPQVLSSGVCDCFM